MRYSSLGFIPCFVRAWPHRLWYTGSEVVRQIAAVEKKYQEDLNKAFGSLSEGAFKSLRRQLPITRQKIEWERISGYRLGQDIGGGRR